MPCALETNSNDGLKRGHVVQFNGLLPIKSNDRFITWSCEIMWQTKTIISPLPQCPWPQNLVGWWHGDLPWGIPKHKVIQRFDYVVSQGHVTNKSHYISTNTVPMANKLDRMVTYLDGLLPIKSHDSWITWSCEITRQTKSSISPLAQCLWSPKLVGWSDTLWGS